MKKSLLYFVLFLFANAVFAQGFWSQKSDFGGVARYRSTGVSVGTKGYFLCGALNGVTSTLDLWEYNPSTNAWTQKADFPGIARGGCNMTAFELNGKAYFGMGTYWDGSPSGYFAYNDFYMYDPTTNIWTAKADFPGTGRHCQVSFAINNKGYVATGLSDAAVFLNDMWEYDPIANTWTQKSSIGTVGRANCVAFTINGKAYVGMGRDYLQTPVTDLWEYTPATNSWVQKSSFPGGGRLFMVGTGMGDYGYAGLGTDNSIYYNDWWRYNPSTDAWTQKAPFTGSARVSAACFSIANKAYVGTGYTTWYTKDFYEFTPEDFGTDELATSNTLIYFQQNASTLIVKTKALSEVKVFDISGRIILSKTYNQVEEASLDLSNFPNGTYLAKVVSSGQEVCRKIVKAN